MSDAGPYRSWIVASNVETFDADGAFRALPEVDWSETANAHIRVGDTVYLYATAPQKCLSHQLLVTRTGTPFSEAIDDRRFWGDTNDFDERRDRTWMRLRLVRDLTPAQRARLALPSLQEAGLRGVPQGRRAIAGSVLDLIEAVVSETAPRSAEPGLGDDAAAETAEVEPTLFDSYRKRIESGDYAVEDTTSQTKVRGSAQAAFAAAVKANYDYACAITGVTTSAFLVASHIVAWADAPSIRLDPSNGICLSTLVDRAFDAGYLHITPDSTVEVDRSRLSNDKALLDMLTPYDGKPLRRARAYRPSKRHLERRYASQARPPALLKQTDPDSTTEGQDR
ncbi:HNH endonuclease signature motif containing protein [Mobilicoccus sp.]|uniref:HNH endonuclease n=1 Tax=Mobilicoccus sp. TaxID=2034349 RepID=UPI00289EABCD|nr:HNH endonuclease signature motif containing protein [Mobilicoccus sp.]